jgi:cardiolipin synthase
MPGWILQLEEFSVYLFIALQISAVILTIGHIVLSQRDVSSTVGWTGLVLLVPWIGLLLYWIFGVNRVYRKAHRLRPRNIQYHDSSHRNHDTDHLFADRFPDWLALGHLGDALMHSPLQSGNAVDILIDGDQAYPKMLAAIDRAQTSIALSTYIFNYDIIGKLFVDALCRAYQRGVQVRVLIDGVGQRYSWQATREILRRAGLMVGLFLAPTFPIRNPYLNLRNHRKILVVDGCIGFTGSLNIHAHCLLASQPRYPVKDIHFCLQGPVVQGLMDAFALDWIFTTGESLDGACWYPALKTQGSIIARCVPDGPDEDFDVLRRLILGALAQARKSVRIITPYFLPDQTLMTVLNVTALRGVQVEILIPHYNNLRFVQWATQAQMEQILKNGCQLYLSPLPFEHTKLMLVDDAWCFFGSANWDARSLRLNFELNVECYDLTLCSALNRLFEQKRAIAQRLHIEMMQHRSLAGRLRDGCARLLTPYL